MKSINASRFFAACICIAIGSATSLSLSSCHEEAHANEVKAESPETPAIKVTSDAVTLDESAPQMKSLVMETMRPAEKTAIHVTGRLAWDEESTVRVFPSIAGRVCKIDAQIGAAVSKDQTLAELASPEFGLAQADASKAAADLKLAERNLQRLQELLSHGAAAKKDVEQAEDDFETKQVEKQRAGARLKLYGITENTIDSMFPLKSPIEGVIVEKNINPGQEVRPDQMLANDPRYVQPLFVISNPRKLSAVLDVTELETAQLSPGQIFRITSAAYSGKTFTGKIDVIGGSIDPVTRTVKVRGSVDNTEGLLKAEMFVAIDLEAKATKNDLHASTALIDLPSKAVFLKNNQHCVFVEQAPGFFQRRTIDVTGETQDRVLAMGSIQAGQRVVAEGGLLLDALTDSEAE